VASLASDAKVRSSHHHTRLSSANCSQNPTSSANTQDSTRSEEGLRRRTIRKASTPCQRRRRTRPLSLRRNQVLTIRGKQKQKRIRELQSPTIELLSRPTVPQGQNFLLSIVQRPSPNPSPIDHSARRVRPACQRRRLRPGRVNKLCTEAPNTIPNTPICP
jgi:hypothetical protein